MSMQTERCRVAIEVGLNSIMSECSGSKEVVLEKIKDMLGMDKDEEPSCDGIELNAETCSDTPTVRAWVMCRAWDLLQEEDYDFGSAIKLAWQEARNKCEDYQVNV